MKVICIGRNYLKHIKELKNKKNDSPVIFLKPETSIIKKNQPFFIPDFSKTIHHELEFLVKINRVGKFISSEFAHKYYDEISIGIDFTARDVQDKLKMSSLPWEKSKSFDGSALIGKWINKKKFKNISNIKFHMTNNGKVVQNGNTSEMIWNVDQLISEISKFFTLKIGDVIFTGTPAGVAEVNEGDHLIGFMDSEELFKLKIK